MNCFTDLLRNLLIGGQTSCASASDGLQTTTQGLGNLGRVALAPFCHPDPLPGGSYRPVPATSSFKPLLGGVLRLSGLHNCSTMGTQGPNIVRNPPSAYGHCAVLCTHFHGLATPRIIISQVSKMVFQKVSKKPQIST